MPAKQRALWLGVLLAAAIVTAMVMRSGEQAPARGAAPQARATRPAAQPDAPQPPADINLDVLAAPRNEPVALGRNPFRFQQKPEPAAAPMAQRLPGVPDDQVDAPPPAAAGPPEPPPITLKFIGIVQKADGTKIAVLSDGRGPISGREGEEIEGRYKILRIGTESIELAYLDGRGKRTIRLNGQ